MQEARVGAERVRDPLLVKARLYNNRLREARLELAMNCREIAEAIGVSYTTYCGCENLSCRPGAGTKRKIADFHGLEVSYLFPDSLAKVSKTHSERTIPEDALLSLEEVPLKALGTVPSDAEASDDDRLKAAIGAALKLLNFREERIVRQTVMEGRTLGEVAKGERVTKERIRQIQQKALRKLQSPAFSEGLLRYSRRRIPKGTKAQ